jgi:hypothetical protein
MIDPDAFPVESLSVSQDTVARLRRQQPHWRPWGAYALMQYIANAGQGDILD